MNKTFGTAIPVSALRTKNSVGCGEFSDLPLFAQFCKNAGLTLIQLLPVNDTGTGDSPYSALSAFALNPIYISLASLPEMADAPAAVRTKLKKLQKAWEILPRFIYTDVRNEKLLLLHQIFDASKDVILADSELAAWITENPWITDYSVFMVLKDKHLQDSWKNWGEYTKVSRSDIEERWNTPELQADHMFYAWMQYRADQQFLEARKAVTELGIKLKGDMPIMMNEDSHDAWAYPEFFNHNLRAGAPADGTNPTGQNWGFPTYNWENLAASNYSWWKDRLATASKYYDVYRIDHVLGFFRIWAVPEGESTALLGHTDPYEAITTKELTALGFDENRIRWLSEPHIPTRCIEEVNNNDYLGSHGYLHLLCDRIGDEELWLFKKTVRSESDITNRDDIPWPVRQRLAEKWRDRMLIVMGKNKFYPLWTYSTTTAWQSLNDTEKESIQELFAKKQKKMDRLWEKQARTVLGELTGSTSMSACAEDLGAGISCMPKVLSDLNIQSLRVVRWNRAWDQEGQPFYAFEDYPEQSVTTSSVHDSTTLRQWWLTEPDAIDFAQTFCPELEDDANHTWNAEIAARILAIINTSASRYIIHPIQDLLTLNDVYAAENPEDERVNIPGTVTAFNWAYRLPVPVETLLKDKSLTKAVKNVVQ